MAQEPVEVILSKQLAGLLSVPIVVYNREGDIIFYNEATEKLTGLRFNETGRISRGDGQQMFQLSDEDDRPIARHVRPVEQALGLRRPAHSRFYMRAPTWNGRREFQATTTPLIAHTGEVVGALMMLWEPDES